MSTADTRGMQPATRKKLRRAATLRAHKHTWGEIAAELKTSPPALYELRRRYPDLWAKLHHKAVQRALTEHTSPQPGPDQHRVLQPSDVTHLRVPHDGKSMTLAAFLHAVYVPLRIDLKPDSIEQIESGISRFSEWAGRPATLADLTDVNVRQFMAALAKHASAETVNSKRAQLLALWRLAYQESMLDELPRKVPKLRTYGRAPEAWTLAEVGRIMQAALETRGEINGIEARLWWFSLLMAIYDTGERRGAMLGARTADVDLEGRTLFLPAERRKDRRDRWHAISEDTAAAIRAIHDPARELLWPWPHCLRWLSTSLRQILQRAGVRHGRGVGGLFHKLRRTSGTLVEAEGGDGSRHLGHNRKVFETHYLDPRLARRAHLARLPRPIKVTSILEPSTLPG